MLNNKEFYESIMPIEQKIVDYYKSLCHENKFENVLEIGSGWGLFTRSVMEGCDAKITTIDKINDLETFQKNTAGYEKRIKRVIGSSSEKLPGLISLGNKYDLIYVDGDHGYDGVVEDLEKVKKLILPNTIIILDDVFHKNNWKPYKDGFDYGVAKAMWEFVNENNFSKVEIINIGHGVVKINI